MAEAGLLAGLELVVRLVLVLVRSQGRREWMRKIGVDHNTNSKLKGPKIKVETLLYGKYQHIKVYLNKAEDEDFTVSRAVCPPWSGVTLAEMQGGRVEIN